MSKELNVVLNNDIVKTSNVSSKTSEKKEGTSLFDQLMNKAVSDASSNKETSIEKVTSKTNSDKNIKNNKIKTTTDTKPLSNTSNKQTTSLMDRLLLEANEKISTDKKDLSNNIKKDNTTSTKISTKTSENQNLDKAKKNVEPMVDDKTKSSKSSTEKVNNTIKNKSAETINAKIPETGEKNVSNKPELISTDEKVKDNKTESTLNSDKNDLKNSKAEAVVSTSLTSKTEDVVLDSTLVKTSKTKTDKENIILSSLESKKNLTSKTNIKINNEESPNKEPSKELLETKKTEDRKLKETTNNVIKDANSLKKNETNKDVKLDKSLVTNEKVDKNTDLNSANNKDNVKNISKNSSIQNEPLKNDNNNLTNKNEKVALELAKINHSEAKLQTVDVSNKDLKSSNKAENKNIREHKDIKTELHINTLKNDYKKDTAKIVETKLSSKDNLLTNIYLSSIQKDSSKNELENVKNSKETVLNAKNSQDVKKAAKNLKLDLSNVEIDTKRVDKKVDQRSSIMDRISSSKSILKSTVENFLQTSTTNDLVENIKEGEDISLNVNSNLALTMQTRIIGAKQQLGSMMSDIARKMYENYKPPVTAFRMNLNPGTLGSISVILKSEKDNGLSISLNMSNSATLDAMVDNQTALRAALAKSFNTEGNFSLDFNMQENSNSEKFSDNLNQQNQPKEQQHTTSELLQSLTNNIEDEVNETYM